MRPTELAFYDYQLPDGLIAQTPLKSRQDARLLIVDRKAKSLRHDQFKNLAQYLPPSSFLVLNNSKVVPARLLGTKSRTGGKVEILLLKRRSRPDTYEALLRPFRRIQPGEEIIFSNSSLRATVIDPQQRLIRFNRKDVASDLKKIGHMPLPPYIKRADDSQDREFYQTVYARYAGSVAAPTAGLHFTEQHIRQLKRQGHKFGQATLHINHATFKLITAPDIRQHLMHTEQFSMSNSVYQKIKQAKQQKRKIVAVGTTSCRVLETVGLQGKFRGETNLFIFPGYDFRLTDCLLTNFHLPLSSLLMLVYAFGSSDLIKRAYQEAIQQKYRFYSYGDAMLIV